MNNLENFKCMPLYSDIINNRQMHSIMLICPDDMLLDDYAKNICLTMFCEGDTKPCLDCNYCKKILHNNCVDIIEYPKRDTVIKKDDLNEITSSLFESPYEADIKVYVLSNMSSMDRMMQNKLLKSLEEPPANVFFILKVNNENQILQTIKSRCRKIYLPMNTEKELLDYFEKIYTKKDVNDAISICNGSMSMAKKYIESDTFDSNLNLVFDILLNYRKSNQTIIFASALYDKKDDFLDIINIYLKILQDVNYIRIGARDMIFSQKHLDKLLRICGDFSVDAIFHMVENSQLLVEKIDRNCNYNSIIDSFLLGILEVRHQWPI